MGRPPVDFATGSPNLKRPTVYASTVGNILALSQVVGSPGYPLRQAFLSEGALVQYITTPSQRLPTWFWTSPERKRKSSPGDRTCRRSSMSCGPLRGICQSYDLRQTDLHALLRSLSYKERTAGPMRPSLTGSLRGHSSARGSRHARSEELLRKACCVKARSLRAGRISTRKCRSPSTYTVKASR